MKILELEDLLPRLDESGKDVDTWSEEFVRLMKLADINTPSSIHTWAMECVEGKLRGVLQDLVTINEDGEEVYPNVKQMKKALEDALEVTPQLKCKRLQKLKIKKNETIKNFNWRYKKLYNNLPRLYQEFITVDDYAESISYRPYARAQVITNQCVDLEEAFEEAELAERAETNAKNFSSDKVFTTIYPANKGSHQHPFSLFRSNYSSRRNDVKSIQSNRTGKTESKKVNKNKEIRCYKCYQLGHVMKSCPYSYKELAEMEESGKLEENRRSLN